MYRTNYNVGDLDNPHRAYAYEGIVINGFEKLENELVNLVYVIRAPTATQEILKTIVGLHQKGFELNVDATNLQADEINRFRNIKRRLAEPLLFGAFVQWNDEDFNIKTKVVYSFSRTTPLHCVTDKEHGYQMKIGGVVNPSKPEFWNHICSINIPADKWSTAEPDVWLNAWVIVEFTGTTPQTASIHFKFLEFEDFELFDVSIQHFVSQAPWNVADMDSKFMTMTVYDHEDDDEYGIEVEEPASFKRPSTEWHDYVKEHLGLFVGNRLIISKDLPQFDFIIPVSTPLTLTVDREPIYPTPGEYYYFTASWSVNHRKYFVTEMKTALELVAHHVTQVGHLSVKVIVSKLHPGLFIDCDSTLGLIDDPDNKLALFKLLPFYHDLLTAMVEIRPVRASENKSVRYRIVRRSEDDETMREYEHWIETSEFKIKSTGVVVGTDCVYAPKYPNIYFRVPKDLIKSQLSLVIGSNWEFEAVHLPGQDAEMLIIFKKNLPSQFKMYDTIRRYIKPVVTQKSLLYRVDLKRDQYHEQLVQSPFFGAIDSRDVKIDEETFTGWIMKSPIVNGSRQASTLFELVSTSHCPPRGVEGTRKEDDDSDFSANNSSSSRQSARSSATSQRFYGRSFNHEGESANSSASGRHFNPLPRDNDSTVTYRSSAQTRDNQQQPRDSDSRMSNRSSASQPQRDYNPSERDYEEIDSDSRMSYRSVGSSISSRR